MFVPDGAFSHGLNFRYRFHVWHGHPLQNLKESGGGERSPPVRMKFNSYNPTDNATQWLDYRPVILGLVAASYGNSTKYNPRDVPKIMLTIFRFCLYAETKEVL